MVRDTLYFGRNRPDGGTVDDAEWRDFLDEVVTPRFPDGLTVTHATGQWRGASGAVEQEASEVVTLLHAGDAAARGKVADIASEYKRRFRQEAVLRERTSACASFLSHESDPVIERLSPTLAGWLADAILALHVGIVLFVVLGLVTILLGGWRRWPWVRNFAFRTTHLALMVFIAAQAWLGQLCPLTIWEQTLRRHAGQQVYTESFVAHWLSRLIFFEAPWWAFVAAYTAFAALVIGCWWWVPPRRRTRTTATG